MLTDDTQAVRARIFLAIQKLIDYKVIRGTKTFCVRYEIDRRNFYKAKNNPDCDQVKLGWLVYLSRDFKISTEWLLLGEGSFFKPPYNVSIVKALQKNCKIK